MTNKEAYIASLKSKLMRYKTNLAREDLHVEMNR